MARQHFKRLFRDRDGAVSVEFSLVIGLLIIIVMAAIEFGMVLMARNQMSYELSRAARAANLDPTISATEIAGMLEDELSELDGSGLTVEFEDISGTNFVEIVVTFPYEIRMPFSPVRELDIAVSTLAPLVSATQ